MSTNCICSIGGDVQPGEQMLNITLFAGTSSVSQSYSITDNNIIDITADRTFIVEAVLLNPFLADFDVGGGNLQDRDSAALTIRDDDGELLSSIRL